MSRAYKFHDPEGPYLISYAVVEWIDVLTRPEYKDIVVERLRHCQKDKGLQLFAWVIMSNHVHLIARSAEGSDLAVIMRDHKKYTSKQIVKAIQENSTESRREWMLSRFRMAGQANINNKEFQFWRQDNKPLQLATNEAIDRRWNTFITTRSKPDWSPSRTSTCIHRPVRRVCSCWRNCERSHRLRLTILNVRSIGSVTSDPHLPPAAACGTLATDRGGLAPRADARRRRSRLWRSATGAPCSAEAATRRRCRRP
jgi:REP element-mobilizing transposase RayT